MSWAQRQAEDNFKRLRKYTTSDADALELLTAMLELAIAHGKTLAVESIQERFASQRQFS